MKHSAGTLTVEFAFMRRVLTHGGFTLIELMVVAVLMALAVSMAVFRLDGLSDSGRLRSTASQLSSIVRLAQTQARTSGSVRLIEYVVDGPRITIRSPEQSEGRWYWDSGRKHPVLGGVRIDRILVGGSDGNESSRDELEDGVMRIRIGPDGRYIPHAVVITMHNRWAVVVLRPMEQPRHALLESKPSAASLDLLMLDMERLP